MNASPPLPDIPSKHGILLLRRADTDEYMFKSVPIAGKARKLRVRWNLNDPSCPPTEIRTDENGITHYIWR